MDHPPHQFNIAERGQVKSLQPRQAVTQVSGDPIAKEDIVWLQKLVKSLNGAGTGLNSGVPQQPAAPNDPSCPFPQPLTPGGLEGWGHL